MKRTRRLGVTVAMALALTAVVGASSASANFFKVYVEPAKWSGSLTGKSHVLSLNEESYTCANVAFSGETTIKTLSEVTVAPELAACLHNGVTAGWDTHGCKFRFKPGAGSALVGSLDIVGCESPMSNNTSGCITEIGNQAGLGPVEYKNVGPVGNGTITAIANISGLPFTRKGTCSKATGTFYNGTYTGEWTIKGSTLAGFQAGVEVESTLPAPFTKFAGEEAPATIAGTNTAAGTKRMTVSGVLTCEKYSLKGTSAVASSATITLAPSYNNCTFGGEAIPDSSVTAGDCSYVFHVNNEFDIVGANCAKNPITIIRASCVVTIGPQSGLSSNFAYSNEGSGKLRTVSMAAGVAQGVTYTAVGSKCNKEGTFTGTINSKSQLSATNSGGAPQGFSME